MCSADVNEICRLGVEWMAARLALEEDTDGETANLHGIQLVWLAARIQAVEPSSPAVRALQEAVMLHEADIETLPCDVRPAAADGAIARFWTEMGRELVMSGA